MFIPIFQCPSVSQTESNCSTQTSAIQMKTEQIHFRWWFRTFFRCNRRTRPEHLHWAELLLEGESEFSSPVVVDAAEVDLSHAHTRVSWGRRHLEPVRPVRRRIEKAARLGSVVLVQYGRTRGMPQVFPFLPSCVNTGYVFLVPRRGRDAGDNKLSVPLEV